MSKKALLIIDVQNDFCPGGSLAVPKGDKVIAVLNKYISYFSKKKYPIFASRDWHPKKTGHFKDHGGIWPQHCVMNTKGAEFHPKLKLPDSAIIVSKGMDPDAKSYSAFLAYDKNNNGLFKILHEQKITELYVGGLATDYCVKASVLDALQRGIKVKLLTDAIAGVNLKKNDSKRAIADMAANGAEIITFSRLDK